YSSYSPRAGRTDRTACIGTSALGLCSGRATPVSCRPAGEEEGRSRPVEWCDAGEFAAATARAEARAPIESAPRASQSQLRTHQLVYRGRRMFKCVQLTTSTS